MDKNNKKYTAPEAPSQEQQSNIYPLKVVITNKVGDGMVSNGNCIINSTNAIKVTVEIDSSEYDNKLVYEGIKSVCQRLLEYYLWYFLKPLSYHLLSI